MTNCLLLWSVLHLPPSGQVSFFVSEKDKGVAEWPASTNRKQPQYWCWCCLSKSLLSRHCPSSTRVVSSQSSLGGLKVGWERHSGSSLTEVTTLLTHLNLSVPRLCIGFELPIGLLSWNQMYPLLPEAAFLVAIQPIWSWCPCLCCHLYNLCTGEFLSSPHHWSALSTPHPSCSWTAHCPLLHHWSAPLTRWHGHT